MGEAERHREALRREILELGGEWDFPASSWEEALCAELKASDAVIVTRVPSELLAWMRMRANRCHDNVRWYAENDPSGKSRAVVGWWVQWPIFILHSVVETEGQMFCVTPSSLRDAEFSFIPDPKINIQKVGDIYSVVRDGHEIGPGVRLHPDFTMAQNRIIRERLLAGADPDKARNFTEKEFDALKRAHISDVP
jgi:hypothetical protein